MPTKVHKLLIIGSGPAGLTAAIYASRANLAPVVIDGNKPGGQLMTTSYVENWPGEKSILGPELMIKIRKHAESFGTTFAPGTVDRVDFLNKPFRIFLSNKKELHAETIIITTGSSPNRLGCPGEEEYWGKGVTTCAVCDGALYKDKRVLVIGGGDSAMEDASFLTKFTDKITLIQNLDALTASHAMQQRVLNNPKINIIYNSTVSRFEGNKTNVTGVEIKNLKTNETKKIAIDGAFLAIGLKPNTKAFKDQLALTDYGHIQLYKQTETSVPGIFAAGDVADAKYRQAITSAGTGCAAALDAERYLSNKENS